MSEHEEPTLSQERRRGAIELLAGVLVLFAGIKIVSTALSFVGAIVAAGGVDGDASRTIYWAPQMLFYTFFFASARRVRRFEALGRRAVVSLSGLSLTAIALYTVAEFTIGPGGENPSMALALKLRMFFVEGEVWDVLFPLLAILSLRSPEARRLFEAQ